MKIFVLIISFYMLGLSGLPCGDRNECNINVEQTISASANHEKHNHDTEHCTPFCTCSCCATSVVYTDISGFTMLKPQIKPVKYPALISSFFPQITYAIWQPPKIA